MKKIELGQFFTKGSQWIQLNSIQSFIDGQIDNIDTFIDPFVGEGDMLTAIQSIYTDKKVMGYDIDKELVIKGIAEGKNIKENDSLKNIPINQRGMIITNPPYLGKPRVKRLKLESLYQYFEGNNHEDLYLVALEQCMAACSYGIAIIPETFILQNFSKEHIVSINIIEDSLFVDTDVPVCIICYDKNKEYDTKVYKNNDYIGKYSDILSKSEVLLQTKNKPEVAYEFNNKYGLIGLRGVDGVKEGSEINFFFRDENILSPNKIKVSSRSLTYIKASVGGEELSEEEVKRLIDVANTIILKYRRETKDILMASFKGNTKKGVRRRRLDYKTARKILEKAFEKISQQ